MVIRIGEQGIVRVSPQNGNERQPLLAKVDGAPADGRNGGRFPFWPVHSVPLKPPDRSDPGRIAEGMTDR